ncbi:MAG: M14 family zinc carboxypeptidase [Phycisphaerales bacterium]|jgi:protein MpaA
MNACRLLPLLFSLLLAACAGRPQDYLTPPGDRVDMPAPPALESAATQLGASRQGRPIFVRTHGAGPTGVLVIGLIHGDEPEVYQRFDDLWLRLRTAGYEGRLTLHAIANMNPDGLERQRRGNARGVDLNRNWPARNFRPSTAHGPNPLSEPEAAAVHRFIQQARPAVIVVFHSTGGGPFVDPDGPMETAGPLAEAFVRAAARVDPSWRMNADFTNPAGSLGSWYGLDEQQVVLTVELRPGTPPEDALAAATAGTLAVLRTLSGP